MQNPILWLAAAATVGLGACSPAIGPEAIEDPSAIENERMDSTRAPAGGTSGGMNAGVPGSF